MANLICFELNYTWRHGLRLGWFADYDAVGCVFRRRWFAHFNAIDWFMDWGAVGLHIVETRCIASLQVIEKFEGSKTIRLHLSRAAKAAKQQNCTLRGVRKQEINQIAPFARRESRKSTGLHLSRAAKAAVGWFLDCRDAMHRVFTDIRRFRRHYSACIG